MKVAITDYTFSDLDIERRTLASVGADVVAGQCKTTAELISMVRNVDAVITQFAPVNADVIGSMEEANYLQGKPLPNVVS